MITSMRGHVWSESRANRRRQPALGVVSRNQDRDRFRHRQGGPYVFSLRLEQSVVDELQRQGPVNFDDVIVRSGHMLVDQPRDR